MKDPVQRLEGILQQAERLARTEPAPNAQGYIDYMLRVRIFFSQARLLDDSPSTEGTIRKIACMAYQQVVCSALEAAAKDLSLHPSHLMVHNPKSPAFMTYIKFARLYAAESPCRETAVEEANAAISEVYRKWAIRLLERANYIVKARLIPHKMPPVMLEAKLDFCLTLAVQCAERSGDGDALKQARQQAASLYQAASDHFSTAAERLQGSPKRREAYLARAQRFAERAAA